MQTSNVRGLFPVLLQFTPSKRSGRGGRRAPASAGAAGGPTAQDADGKDGQCCGELAPRKLREVPDQRPPARAGEPAAWRGRRAGEAGAGPGAGWGLGTREGLPGAQRNPQRIVLLHQGIFFVVNEMSLRNRTRHTLNMQGTSRREACMTSEARTELTENSSSLVGDRHSGSWAGSARSGLPSAPCAARPARKDGHPRGSRLEHLRRKALPRTTPANRWLETPAWAAVVRDGAVRELKGHTALVLVRLSPLQMPPH